MPTSTTRRREQPSGHAQMEQQLGEEDCAGIVCCQKPPGRTGIRRRRCRFFTGRCNKRQRHSVTQEADGRFAAPPSLNSLVRRLYERNPKCVKRPEGPRMMAQLLHQDRCRTVSSRDNFSIACRDEVGSAGTDTGSTTRQQDLPSGHA
jgi:hypothetical protein